MEKIMEIKRTKYYDMFKFRKENREINYNKVLRLKQKLIDDGRQIMPIILNSNFEIIDGQHRFQVLKELGWEVNYYIDDAVTAMDLISINNTQTNWGMLDFIHYYSSLGNEKFQRLEKIVNKYSDFTLKVILVSIAGSFVKDYKIKEGIINFTDEEFARGEEVLEYLQELKNNIKMKVTQVNIFFFLVVKTYYLEDIDKERLFKNIVERYGTENYGNSQQCAMVLEHWYNHKARNYRYISNEILPRR